MVISMLPSRLQTAFSFIKIVGSLLFVGGAMVTGPIAMTAGAVAAATGAIVHMDAVAAAAHLSRQAALPVDLALILFTGGFCLFVIGAWIAVSDIRRRSTSAISMLVTTGQPSALTERRGQPEER